VVALIRTHDQQIEAAQHFTRVLSPHPFAEIPDETLCDVSAQTGNFLELPLVSACPRKTAHPNTEELLHVDSNRGTRWQCVFRFPRI
jgi:hypothetical protein